MENSRSRSNIAPYLFCSALLFVSNLGFPPMIQYTTRALGIGVTWFFLLYGGQGSLKVKGIRHEPTLLLVVYIGICALSCFWSISPFQSVMKVVELVTDFMLLERLAREEAWPAVAKKTMDVYMLVCLALLAVTLVGFFVKPGYFANRGIQARRSLLGIRLGEGFLGANKASALSAFCLCWLVLLRPWQGLRSAAAVGMCLLIMFLSQSRASLVMLPVIVAFRFFKYREKYRILYILAGFAFAAFLAMNLGLLVKYLMRGQTTDVLMSGSGRVDMWSLAMEDIAKNPIFGYGFGAGGELAASRFHGGVATVHGGIFETLLGTGLLGLSVLSLQFIYALRVVASNIYRQGLRANFVDAVILMYYVIRTGTSLGIANWHSPELLLWWLFLFAIGEERGIQRIYRDENRRVLEERSEWMRRDMGLLTDMRGGVEENG